MQGETGQKKPSYSLTSPSWAAANKVRPEGGLGTVGQVVGNTRDLNCQHLTR